ASDAPIFKRRSDGQLENRLCNTAANCQPPTRAQSPSPSVIMIMSLVSAFRVKTNRLPSRDHSTLVILLQPSYLKFVNCLGALPSNGSSQTLETPERLSTYAKERPPGVQRIGAPKKYGSMLGGMSNVFTGPPPPVGLTAI